MKILSPSTVALACAALFAAHGTAQITINEFSYDDTSTDDREYVELYNAGSTAVDISGWVLESIDQVGPNTAYTVPGGTMIAAGGFYTFGSALVPNVDLIVGATDLWENDQESLELRDGPAGNLIDAVVYETNKQLWALTPELIAQCGDDALWGNHSSTDGIETSWARNRDGYDTDRNGRDFRMMPSTPGATNNVANLLPMFENFDAGTVDTPVASWGASFLLPHYIDPQTVGINPNPIPLSPQGGNAFIAWDTAGGGNCAMLLTDVADSVSLECYVYLDATPEAATEYESWCIGIQGTNPTFYNTPDPSGLFGFTANGLTGVAVIHENTDSRSVLYLVDAGDGGWAPGATSGARVLGQIAIVPGQNDGWQRLRIHAGRGFAEAMLGGTFGQRDGTLLAGSISQGDFGGIHVGYREFVTQNGTVRPPTIDQLIIVPGNADIQTIGVATPNTIGEPSMSANGLPIIGWNGFSLEAEGLSTSGPALLQVGTALNPTPLDLNALIGAPAGTLAYVNALFGVTVAPDAQGRLSLPLPVPNTPSASGSSLFVQLFDVDFGISAAVQIAQTPALQITLGN